MASVSSTFTVAGAAPSASLFVKAGETFRLSLTNTWVGTVLVEESNNGAIAWRLIASFTANTAQDLESKPYDRVIRLSNVYTSGTVTYSFSNVTSAIGPLKYQTVPIGSIAYTSINTNGVASTAILLSCASLIIDKPFLSTGAAILQGTTIGTNKLIYLLYDATGKLVCNTATAGVITANASTFLEIPWTSTLTLPAGNYFLGVQIDGTTDTMRYIVTSTNVNVVCGQVASVFGTAGAFIVPPTTFTTATGLVGYVY